jgi:hypothetical protein
LHYDWSDPNHVVLTTTDSNIWGGASGRTYTFTHQPNGSTEIDVEVVREGKNLKGRLLGFVLRTVGRSVLERRLKTASGRSRLGTDWRYSRSPLEPKSWQQLVIARSRLTNVKTARFFSELVQQGGTR